MSLDPFRLTPRLLAQFQSRDSAKFFREVNRLLARTPGDAALLALRGKLRIERAMASRHSRFEGLSAVSLGGLHDAAAAAVKAALGDFQRSLERDPDNTVTLTWRARLHLGRRNVKSALRDLDRAIALAQRNVQRKAPAYPIDSANNALILRSTLRLMRNDVQGGWDDLMKAYELYPYVAPRYAEARDTGNSGEYAPERRTTSEAAINAKVLIRRLDAAIDRSPRLREAWAWRGALKRVRRDYPGAVDDLSRALKLGLRTPTVLTWLGEARLQTGDGRGLREMEQSASMPSRQAWHLAWCGRAKLGFERDEGALAYLDEAIAAEPGNAWNYAWRAEAKRILRKPHGIVADLDRALALDPYGEHDGWIRAWRGMACLQEGRAKAAVRDFTLALKRLPRYALAFHGRALAWRRLRRLTDWISDFDRAARLDEKYGQWRHPALAAEAPALLADLERMARSARTPAAAHCWRGALLAQTGDAHGALQALDAAEAPRHVWSRAWRGEALRRLGRLREAETEFGRALTLDGRHATALAWRAKARLALGLTRAALGDFASSIKADPRFAWVFFDRGRLRLLLDDPAGAAEDISKGLSLDRGDLDAQVDLAVAYGRIGERSRRRLLLRDALSRDRQRAESRLKAWSAR